MKIIDKGAEATISADENVVLKDRVAKGYRLKEIDDKLRKFRTRREAKVLNKLESIDFPAPRLHAMCDNLMQLRMDMVNGNKLRDVLYKEPLALSEEVGKKIGILHKNNIIHGDLTTSNMILDARPSETSGISGRDNEIKFIDFGLSFFSTKEEDKAVDLHLLRQALESKHYDIWEKCFEAALRGYKESYPEHSVVLDRLKQVENRGRNKGKF
ncbi:Kae1-associated serine/threonine protein kinase [Candidatus Woesearchaeota archaeon]|nr:Kae1-associated serine/threonine protein kinase [Candidatus Woesearchaeota archaeon]